MKITLEPKHRIIKILVYSALIFVWFIGTKGYGMTSEKRAMHRKFCGSGYLHNSGNSKNPWVCKKYGCGSSYDLPCQKGFRLHSGGRYEIDGKCPAGTLATTTGIPPYHNTCDCGFLSELTVSGNCPPGYQCFALNLGRKHRCFPKCLPGYVFVEEKLRCINTRTGFLQGEGIEVGEKGEPIEVSEKSVVELFRKPEGSVNYYHTFRAHPEAGPTPRAQPKSRQIDESARRKKLLKAIESLIARTDASEEARQEASRIIRHVLENVLVDVLQKVVDAGYKIYIVPSGKKLTELPEFSYLRGGKTLIGRSWDTASGITDPNRRIVGVLENDLLGNIKGYAPRKFFVHNLGLAINFSVKPDWPFNRIKQNYDNIKSEGGQFANDDASSNEYEYFAVATEIWFGVHRDSKPLLNNKFGFWLAKKRIVITTHYDRSWLEKNDPGINSILNQFYEAGMVLAGAKARNIKPHIVALPGSTGAGTTGKKKGILIAFAVIAGAGILAALIFYAVRELKLKKSKQYMDLKVFPAELSVQEPAMASNFPSVHARLLDGKYEIKREIGAGGMGMVYEGWDCKLNRKVAIKKMRSDLKAYPRERSRFVQEARLIARLNHPYIVGIHAIVEKDSEVYLVLDYVDGEPLSIILEGKKRFPLEDCKNIFNYVCQAVHYAHKENVIHRDLKPSNIMIDKNNFAKVMDFGLASEIRDSIAKLTSQSITGTPAYMAPEQYHGIVRPESDVYAMGVCLYEMLIGDIPFKGIDTQAKKEQMKFKEVSLILPGLSKKVDEFMKQALEPDPERRIKTATEFLTLLKNL